MKKLKLDVPKLNLKKTTITTLSKPDMSKILGGDGGEGGYTLDGSYGCLTAPNCVDNTDPRICTPPSAGCPSHTCQMTGTVFGCTY